MSLIFKAEITRLAAAVAQHEQSRISAAEQEAITASRRRLSAKMYHAPATKIVRENILAALGNGERLTTVAIGKIIGKNRSTVYIHLCEMSEDGILQRSSSKNSPVWWVAGKV